jgi:hypothetical protein
MTSPKAFWISLVVLLAIHTAVSIAGYQLFTARSRMPGDGTPAEVTTPEQRADGQISFRVVTSRSATPIPVLFYICGGYVALGAAVLFMVYTRLRTG